MRRTRNALALLLALVGLAGCATVPDSSAVQVLRQVGTGDEAVTPAREINGKDPLDLVRDFVSKAGSPVDKHGEARRYLAPDAQAWDDTANLTVLDGQIDTVPAPGAAAWSSGATTIRIRGMKIGRLLTTTGAFEPDQATFALDVDVVRRDGQWRISRLPDGVVMSLASFRDNYRPVPIWFVDPARRLVVPDQRYVPWIPAKAQPSRVMELLLAGPSGALQGAAVSELPEQSKPRSNVSLSSDGVHVVDLGKIGDLDLPSRKLLAAQVVQSLAEVNVPRVRLLVNGEPLVPGGTQDWTREDIQGLIAELPTAATVPALIANGGRLLQLAGPVPTPLPGPFGNGSYVAESGAYSVDGRMLAVVAKSGSGRILMLNGGTESGVVPVPLSARTMTRPTWNPVGTEVMTVLDSSYIARVTIDSSGNFRTGKVNDDELASRGPIQDMRLSRDGMRLVAVVGGGLYTAAVARSLDGEVAIRNVRRLRPTELGQVVAADWRSSESIAVITRTSDLPVVQVTADGLGLQQITGNNLTPPLTAVAASPNRPLLVTDQAGIWTFGGGEQDAWRQMLGAAADAVPAYPG